jgi:hypothetical protein
MTYAEDTWSAPQAVASPPGFPEYPRLTVTRGNQVHLAFFVRDQNFVDSGDYVIWTVNGSTPAAPSTLPSRPLPGAGESVPRLPTADVPTEDSVPRAYPTPPAVPQPLDHEIDATNPTTQRIRPVVLATFATVGTLVVVSIGLAVLRRVRGM